MEPKQYRGSGAPEDVPDNVVPFKAVGRRRMVMVPEDEWREVMTVVREWKKVRSGCPIARRLMEVE